MQEDIPEPQPALSSPEQGGNGDAAGPGRRGIKSKKPGQTRPIPWVQQVKVAVFGRVARELKDRARSLGLTLEDTASHILEQVQLVSPEQAAFAVSGEINWLHDNTHEEPHHLVVPITRTFHRRLTSWAEASGLSKEELAREILLRNIWNPQALLSATIAVDKMTQRRTTDYQQPIQIPPPGRETETRTPSTGVFPC